MKNHNKTTSLTSSRLLLICVKYYFSEMDNTILVLAIITTCTILRRLLTNLALNKIFDLNTTPLSTDIFLIYGLDFIDSLLSTFIDYLLAIFFGVFQTKISIRALYKILFNESAGHIDLTSGKTQYAISEGSKAMSKLFKYMFVDFVSKFAYLVADVWFINSRLGRTYLYLSVIVAFVSIIIHIKGAIMSMECKRDENIARGQCDKVIYEDSMNYEIIKSSRTEDLQVDRYNSAITPWKMAYLKHQKVKIVLSFIHDIIFATTKLLFSLYIYYNGVFTKDRSKDTYLCLDRLERSIENVSSMYRKYRESLVTSNMLIYYLEYVGGFASGTTIKTSFNDKICFKNVYYQPVTVSILRNVSFELMAGDKKAIFGRNGSGKSTIFRLIMRIAAQDTGIISIDGIDINEIEIRTYRSLFSYVPQETNLFDDTIINNLIYGNNKSYKNVIDECKKMKIHDDIMKLESGYNTFVGERGVNINGGLRQKIFYVRAFLSDAPILLLDEPTNNLDESSANKLMDLILGEEFEDKTVLVICHDKELVNRFPKCLHFVDGVLKETHK